MSNKSPIASVSVSAVDAVNTLARILVSFARGTVTSERCAVTVPALSTSISLARIPTNWSVPRAGSVSVPTTIVFTSDTPLVYVGATIIGSPQYARVAEAATRKGKLGACPITFMSNFAFFFLVISDECYPVMDRLCDPLLLLSHGGFCIHKKSFAIGHLLLIDTIAFVFLAL